MSAKNLSALFPLDHLTSTVDEAILCFRGMVSTMWCMSTYAALADSFCATMCGEEVE